jgi:hypothetical protein
MIASAHPGCPGAGAHARPFGIIILLILQADEECRDETDNRGGDDRDRDAGHERGPGGLRQRELEQQ